MAAAAPAVAPESADSTMACPYCTERISAQAIVCKHCHRDLLFFAPLRRDLEALARKVEKLEAQNTRLAALIAEHFGKPAPEASEASNASEAPAANQPAAHRPPGLLAKLLFPLLPIACLVAAHWLMVMLLDLNPIYLRVLSVVLPLAFGLLFVARFRVRLPYQLLAAAAIAVSAVAAMTAVVAHVDEQPFWPRDAREWREVVYYILSIGFSHITGILTGMLVLRRRNRGIDRLSMKLAQAIEGDAPLPGRAKRIKRHTESIKEIITLVAPIATAVLSVATGVVGLLKSG